MTAMTLHGRDEPRALSYPSLASEEGRFGRLFPELHGLSIPTSVLADLSETMRDEPPPPESPAGPAGWGTPDPPTPDEGENLAIPAGYTYLGQFIDHDITFDPLSSLETANRPETVRNFRLPRLDLDSVYGGGPAASPYLYDRDAPGKLLITTTPETIEDLPRNDQGTALTGDPRNDENQIVSQLHLAFLKFHNARIDAGEKFEDAQKSTRWHYQWVVLHDFLPRTVGQELVDELRSVGPLFYRWPYQTFMPIEFSVAAYRFGHSQVRNGYRLKLDLNAGGFAVFGAAEGDLRGGRVLTADRKIDWPVLVPVGGNQPTPSRKIDTKLVASLFNLFGDGANPPAPDNNLASRNLRRGVSLGVPSGQAVARAVKAAIEADGGHRQPVEVQEMEIAGWTGETPLWFYILREAELAGGERLGPLGARIVTEVLVGLLEADPTSFYQRSPNWQPDTVPFTLGSFLQAAGAA